MTLLQRAEALARDRDAASSELLARALPLLAEALAAGSHTTADVVRAICEGQPAMAALWNACAAAVGERRTPGEFARVRAQLARAPAALVRAAAAALTDACAGETRPTLLTLSYSGSVAAVLRRLASAGPLRVICAEGRPRVEGRRLAEEMTRAGAVTALVVDAALTSFLPEATAVVAGADALTTDTWVNKVGSYGVAAAASRSGVPVYVISSRDKAVAPALRRLGMPAPVAGDPREVWAEAPADCLLANPYFEAVPADLVTLFLTDVGAIAPEGLGELCARWDESASSLVELLQG